MSQVYGVQAIAEMAEAHKSEHPACAGAMNYILDRCYEWLDDGK